MTATVQQQARALGDPTRHEMYRYLSSASDPVGIAELTAHFGLNHNAIRQHLAKLVAAELVVESVTEAVGPGRPPLVYEVDHRADNQWGSTGPYQRLSVLLTEIISTGDEPVEVGRRAGRRSKLSPLPSDDSAANIAAVMTSQGFDPEVRSRGSKVEIVLHFCPFADAALADPDVVCSLHLGIAQGLAEDTDLAVQELVIKDPRRARCRVRLQRHAAVGRVGVN